MNKLRLSVKSMRMLFCVLIATALARADWFESYQKGEALLEQGRTNEAILELTAALREQPRDAAVLATLGRAEFRAGRYRSAKNYFEKAYEDSRDKAVPSANWAQACLALGEYTRANQLVHEALARYPTDSRLLHLLGQILLKQRHYPEAEVAFRRSLSSRNDPFVVNDLAVLYQLNGEYAESLDLLGRALAEPMPAQAKARIRANLGVVQWNAGARKQGEANLRQALDDMETAVGQNHPDVAWIMEKYAEVLRQSSRRREARDMEAQASRIRSGFAAQSTDSTLQVDWRDLVRERR